MTTRSVSAIWLDYLFLVLRVKVKVKVIVTNTHTMISFIRADALEGSVSYINIIIILVVLLLIQLVSVFGEKA